LHGRKWKKDSTGRAAEASKKSNTRPRRQRAVINENFINVDEADDLAARLIPDDADEFYDEGAELFPMVARLRPRRNHATR
jgi:hypothetical protein